MARSILGSGGHGANVMPLVQLHAVRGQPIRHPAGVAVSMGLGTDWRTIARTGVALRDYPVTVNGIRFDAVGMLMLIHGRAYPFAWGLTGRTS